MHYLHNYNATLNPTDCLFGMKYGAEKFFADDGFGNFVTFGNATVHQLFTSTNDILSLTCAEMRREPQPIPNII